MTFFKVIIFCLLFDITCFAQKSIIIDLKQETNDSITLEHTYVRTNLKSLDWSARLMKKVSETYKNIPDHDSIEFFGNFEHGIQYSYDFYKSYEKDRDKILKFITNNNLDTLALSKEPIVQGFISAVGFYKNKQFLIADANRNEDFSDDIKYEFDIHFRENPLDSLDVISKLPATDYTYQIFTKGKVQTYHRKFVLYPNKKEPYTLDKKQFEYSSKFRLKDYWKGEASINSIPFDFYYQSRDNVFGSLFIKPKDMVFNKTDDAYNNQFKHYTNETFAIDDGLYKVDSINKALTKMYLSRIGENTERYGNRTGSYLKDFELKNLEGKSFKIYDIIKGKNFTLIDFWGTWCGPCIKMTPKLQEFHAKYSAALNILSIAKDDSPAVVKKFISKHKMPWSHAFQDRNKNNPILTDLNLVAFPTFILVDEKGKILYRGGSDTFDDMLKFLK